MGCLMDELFYLLVLPGIVVGLWLSWVEGSGVGLLVVGGLGSLAIASYVLASWETVREEGIILFVVVPTLGVLLALAWAMGSVGGTILIGLGLAGAIALGGYLLASRRGSATAGLGEWPELRRFLGGWFGRDWDDDNPNPDAVIRAFVEESSPEELSAVRAELDGLLALGMPEKELARVRLDELGCHYNPARQGQSEVEWLRSVRARLG